MAAADDDTVALLLRHLHRYLVDRFLAPRADAALAYAAELGAQLDATLHLVHAIIIPVMGIPEMGVAYASATPAT